MSTSFGPKQVEIIYGPNRFQLVDAFLYSRDETVEYECQFQLRENTNETPYVVDFKPDIIQYTDESPDHFNITGVIYRARARAGKALFAWGAYDANTYTGTFNITELGS